MNKIVCGFCGNEENEYGQKYCSECGAELLYINEDFYFPDVDADKDKEAVKKSSYDKKCMITTGNEFTGYEIEEYLTMVAADEILTLGRGWNTAEINQMNYSLNRSFDYKTIMENLKEIRAQLKAELQEQTIDLGGNALVGVRYSEANLVNAGMLLTITGTAVRLHKKEIS